MRNKSLSIDMLSIQIDTKIFEFGCSPSFQQHQIDLLCKPRETEYLRLLDTLEYVSRV